ncbi:MAG: transposase [bacterium]|nr:transposase [bacterium]
MARPLRIEYPGAWYHVSSRGNERGRIFGDDKDRLRFLEALEESIEKFEVEVHCYVLMGNHFHFLLRTLKANLSRFMQRFNTAYTAYYNLRHRRAGHLYQGRFKAIVVEADECLKDLSRYLHLNPVRLKKYKELTVEEKARILKAYRRSSLPGYIGSGKRDEFVKYDAVLDYAETHVEGQEIIEAGREDSQTL